MLWYGFEPNMMIASNDTGSAMNPVMVAKTRLFTWYSGLNFGIPTTNISGSFIYYGIEALAAVLAGSVSLGQKIVVVFWFAGPMLVMYLFIKRIPPFANKQYMALFASILFQFNHFQQHAWRVFWRTRFSTYMLLPILLILLIDYLEGRRNLIRTAIYTGLSVLILNGGGSPTVYGAPIVIVLITIFYYLFINLRNNLLLYLKRSILFILTVGICSFLLSSFWMLPFVYFSLQSYAQTIQNVGGLASTLNWTDVVSLNSGILNLLRNVGLPFWDTTLPDPKLFLTNPVFIMISFIWPILTFSSLFFAKKIGEKKYVVLFLLLTISAIVFTAGTHKPFRDFYIFNLNHIPGYVLFRSPLYKFGNLLWFSYAVLIAFTLSGIIEKIRGKLVRKINLTKIIAPLLAIFFLSLIFLWDYPIFNNKFFGWKPPLTTMLKIPTYVFDFGDWINKQNDFNGRILLLPEFNKGWRSEVFRWGYWSHGSQLIYLLTDKTSMANDGLIYDFGQTVNSQLVDQIYQYLKDDNPGWLTLANQFNIRYLMVRKDFFYDSDWLPTTNPFVYEGNLIKNKQVEKIKTFGEWDLYKIKTDVLSEKIYLDSKPVFYLKKDGDILHLFSLINQNNKEPDKNTFFVSINDFPENIDISDHSIVVVPGPMDIFLPVESGKLLLPKPQYLPSSPLFSLSYEKEQELYKKAAKKEDLINLYLNSTLYRLAELEELIRSKPDIADVEIIAKKYENVLSQIKNNLEELIKGKKDVERLIVRTKGFLIEERKLLKGWIDEQKEAKILETLNRIYFSLEEVINHIPVTREQEAVLSGMINPFYDPDIVFLTSDYRWKIPDAGVYEIYIDKNSSLLNNDSLILKVDQENIEVRKGRISEGEWQKVGEINLAKGEHGLEIITDGVNLSSFRKNDLVFIKSNNQKEIAGNTKISYHKINPTRYKAVISADYPFALVFDEKFDPGWKLYLKEKFTQSNNKKLNIVEQIREILDENIFNTLFLTPLPDEKHFMVNSSINGWFIDLQAEFKGKEFEVIIEHSPQKILYLSILVNIIAFGGSVVYLLLLFKRNRR